jgi:hypothetical protein
MKSVCFFGNENLSQLFIEANTFDHHTHFTHISGTSTCLLLTHILTSHPTTHTIQSLRKKTGDDLGSDAEEWKHEK